MSDEVTIFEKILNKEISADIVFENEKVLAFNDISPQAKTHILFIHKLKKTKNLSEMVMDEPEQVLETFQAIANYAQEKGLDKSGYRIVTNQGVSGGQSVFYTHFHLLADQALGGFGN